MLRAAVIGCGKIGSEFADDPRIEGVYTHAAAYRAADGVELVAVCDTDPAKADRCARRWNLTDAFTDVGGLLDRVRPDIVSICTPDASHAPVLDQVLACRSVRGVLAEKPLAQNVSEAERLVRVARDRGIVLAVNYVRRYSPGHVWLEQAIGSGELGVIQKVLGLYTKGVLHNGTHWFDLARWLVGEISAVQAFAGADARDGEDPTLDVRLEFEGGAAGALQGCSAESFTVFEMDVVGTRGRARLVDSGHRIQMYGVGDSPHYSGYRSLLPAAEHDGGLREALPLAVRDLVECVARQQRPRCSGEDGVSALRIASAAIASAVAGRRMTLTTTQAAV
jgi:predicted dehydrogenase